MPTTPDDRVVFTVNDFDQRSLDQLTSSPSAPGTLATALISAVEAKNLDGVNLDLEGAGQADQAGLTNLVTVVSSALHQVNPHWQVTMDTYASSAGDADGFYDIGALANAVDGFFVMQYSPNVPPPPRPDRRSRRGCSATRPADQYSAAVPANKVILGAPFYGEDWPTTGNTLSATATGPATPLAVPDHLDRPPGLLGLRYQHRLDRLSGGHSVARDLLRRPDFPLSMAQIAEQHQFGGVGIWALGMDGNDPAMVAALDGNAPAVKYAAPGPPATTAPGAPAAPTASTQSAPAAPTTTTTTQSAPPASTAANGSATASPAGSPPATGTTETSTPSPPSSSGAPGTSAAFTYEGLWGGDSVVLTLGPAVAPSVLAEPGAQELGTLTTFATTDPEFACLAAGPDLVVWRLPPASSTAAGSEPATSTPPASTTTTTTPSEPSYTVVVLQPTDCVSASFTFTPPPTPTPTPPTTAAPASDGSGTDPSSTAAAGSTGNAATDQAPS